MILGVAAACYGLALWKVPDLMGHGHLHDPRDRHNARLLVTSVGGAVVLVVGLLYTAGSYRLAHRGQVTDRFIKALERLGSEELYVRYGGIMALEQIVQDAPDQAADAARVLGAFIRTRASQRHIDPAKAVPQEEATSQHVRPPRPAPTDDAQPAPPELPKRPPEDLQAALTALARHNARPRVRRQQPIILERLHLTSAQLNGADLTSARLNGANLTSARLNRANLTGARLNGANLTGAWLSEANLTGAWLIGADLTGAWLIGADLTGAGLDGGVLDGVVWSGETVWPSAEFAAQVRARSEETKIPDAGFGFVVRR